MARIGYARISTHEQNKDLQIDALKEAGCERIFTDEITGSKVERKGLNEALAFLRSGDTFVVWKLDRAGRSLAHLIDLLNDLKTQGVDFLSLTERIDTSTPSGKLVFHMSAAFAEFERDIIRERTRAGLASARARGRLGGRPRKLKNGKANLAVRLHAEQKTAKEICEALEISPSTLYRYVREAREA